MVCPHCNMIIKDGSKFCTECGASLKGVSPARQAQDRRLVADTGMMLGAAARQARLEAVYDEDSIISVRAYNAIMVGVLLWGLLVNILLCAFVGDVYRYIPPLLFLVLYLVCAFVGIRIAAKSNKPAVSFLGYNLVVVPFGLVISSMVYAYGGIGSDVVTYAFVYTMLITIGMLAMVMIVPALFEKLGGALLGCLVGLILCELVLLLLRVPQTVIDWVASGLFALYIGYDIYRSQKFVKTVDNAVDCALDIYLDIANLFIRVLQILGRKKD